ncbi:putative PA domain containing protein [Trypanosoma cruzi]|uniref:PA domain-containing protein n=2 Tax=Trypanosoma cruzi TaxID=5693 RepID=Q4CYK2_TRYCC|nr:hypothetical protein, conserved [Trypanosoma cruzi]EAN85355.1 hypothetical protein, conserved [Trypanosoma cruzi]KAF8302947.1 putative PA domain containing protein [Trypanosoma cruzi]PWV13235.1 putative PA domain containing protein [Trypanosoma cruzi]|eukprot:XP_807206.1 hypothetical protein [Trypanosoma cruzi strain CL Brener]
MCLMRFCLLLFLVTLLLLAGNVMAVRVQRPAFLASRKFDAYKLSVGPPNWSGREHKGEVLLVRGAELCADGAGSNKWKGAIVLALGHECDTVVQALTAQRGGAVGLLVSKSGGYTGSEGEVRIPVEVLKKEDYDAFAMTINQGISIHVSIGNSLNVQRFAD